MNRALLVGINKYPKHASGPLKPFTQLSGCVNDVRAMAKFIRTRCGFAPADIRLLTNSQATKASMVRYLRWLVSRARPGDRLLFFYSGHGAPYPRPHYRGHAHHDTICPFDFDWTRKYSITDMDFKSLFGRLPEGVELIWITDSCFSGGLTRSLSVARTDGAGFKTVPAPERVASILRKARKNPHFKRVGMHAIASQLHGALIAAAGPAQYSYDVPFRGGDHGALTYYLLKALNRGDGLTAPLGRIVEKTRRMAIRGQHQHPELRGERSVMQRPFLAPPQLEASRRRK